MKLINLILVIVVIALVFYVQFKPRPLRGTNRYIIGITVVGLILLIFAILQGKFHLTQLNLILLFTSLIFLSIFCGIWRAMTCHLWVENGLIYRKARWTTMAIWILTVILHTLMTHFNPELYYTMIIYLALSLVAQKVTLVLRQRNY